MRQGETSEQRQDIWSGWQLCYCVTRWHPKDNSRKGGAREDKSGADATGHVGVIMSQYLRISGQTVVHTVDKVGNS